MSETIFGKIDLGGREGCALSQQRRLNAWISLRAVDCSTHLPTLESRARSFGRSQVIAPERSAKAAF